MGQKIGKHLGKNVRLYGCARVLCKYIYIFSPLGPLHPSYLAKMRFIYLFLNSGKYCVVSSFSYFF